MRVGEAVVQVRQVGALAVVQVEDRLDGDRGDLLFNAGLGLITLFQWQLFQCDGHRVGIGAGVRHHAQIENDQVGVQADVLVEDQVLEADRGAVAGAGHLADLALGEDHHLLLAGAVEILTGGTRGAQVVEQDGGVAVLAVLGLEIHRLLDRDQVADTGVVGQVAFFGGVLADVLDEQRPTCTSLPSDGTLDRAVAGRLGQGLQLVIANDVGVARTQRGNPRDRTPSSPWPG